MEALDITDSPVLSAKERAILVEDLASSVSVKALDDLPVSHELVTHLTAELCLSIDPVHTESIQF